MIQGTGSDVGKSFIVAGLCRAYARRGLAVRPFKPQNMSNNAAVVALRGDGDGGGRAGEIGRAQALQARAAGVPAHVDMNPVLLKPQSETGAQIVVRGHVRGLVRPGDFRRFKAALLPEVLASFDRLQRQADLVLVEGAGSPAEINLRAGDIANMGFALAAGVPVVLVADVARGGAIAALVGTWALLEDDERALLAGTIANRFRGDPRLFAGALDAIAGRTGLRSFGVVPHCPAAMRLPAEDAAGLDDSGNSAGNTGSDGGLVVAVPRLARIANFDDLDPLRLEPGVRVAITPPGRPLPAEARLIVIPGSKSTLADLRALRAEGWDIDILAAHRRGAHILGLCAGYQMLGRSVADPQGIEGPPGREAGLALLDVETVIAGEKSLRPVNGCDARSGEPIRGFEMHMGVTSGPDCVRPMLTLAGRAEGARSADGRVMGTAVHGLFASDTFRHGFLQRLGHAASLAYEAAVEAALDEVADHLERHLDLDALLAVARERSTPPPGRP